MSSWQDRWVIIAGGTGALGRHVSAHFSKLGAGIVIPYVDAAEAQALTGLADASMRTRMVPVDLRDEQAVHELADSVPRLDAWVHLTGGFTQSALDSMALADWSAHYTLNVTTTFLACKHALRRMKMRGYGRIVTVGSRAAVEPAAELGAYSSAKAAVVALTRAIAAETRGSDITANCVLPSVIDTPSNRAAMGEADAKRWVSPAALAEVIAFLASPAAKDVRGAAIPVYGNV